MKKTLVRPLLLVILLVLLWVGIASSVGSPNCWDQYQTEEQAILNCENHDDN